MRRFTAFILFIVILFISMTLLGIYVKGKFTKSNVDVLNVTIQIYKYKYGKDERDNQPYKTIILDKAAEKKEVTDVIANLVEIPYDENRTFKVSNCIIKINYKKSTYNDIFTDVYDVWFETGSQTEMIFKKGYFYYRLPAESSGVMFKIINSN